MRKADYAALAAIIKDEWLDAQPTRDFADESCAADQVATMRTLRNVARRFAQSASVNKAEFLRACGIEP
jgi:hypothetical protein